MQVIQVPVLYCFRCELYFTPKTDVENLSVIIPKLCPDRTCRSQTWNIDDVELTMIKEKQKENLTKSPYLQNHNSKQLIKMTNLPILNKYKPKKSEKKPLIICKECETFYFDESSLERHQLRRHHGMCMVCYTSNVYVMIKDGITICKNCFEKQNSKK